jgi:phospholipase/lecithinase/hemolysin
VGARFFSLALAIVVAVAIADAIAHPQGTATLTNAAVKAQTTALNAELGKTS